MNSASPTADVGRKCSSDTGCCADPQPFDLSLETVRLDVPDGTGSDAYGGNWTASIDKWDVQGAYLNGAPVIYLRGIGKPYYNLYMYKYGGVDSNTGLPLYASTVSKDNIAKLQQAQHVYGEIKEGNTVYTTNYSLATRQEFGDVISSAVSAHRSVIRTSISRRLSHSNSAAISIVPAIPTGGTIPRTMTVSAVRTCRKS